jgi:uncharacterized protein (TIGR02145 family)
MRRTLAALFFLIILIPASRSFAGVCGDVNVDGKLNLLDISYVITHLYRGGPAPNCGPAYIGVCGDVNGTDNLNLLDVSYVISYLYRGAPAPICPNQLPVLATASVSEIMSTSAQCGGTITSDGGAEVTARGVCWSTNPIPTVANYKTANGSGMGSFTSSIAGLADNTSYYARAYATNSIGTGYGAIISFTTTHKTGTVTDIDGNIYQTIKIGNQWWMAENLKVTHYQNGDAMPEVIDNAAWEGLTTGAHCAYNNNINNVAIYGRLYNWYAVIDSRNIAPTGWHVPSDAEWETLVDYVGGTSEGGKMKETGMAHWVSPNTGATNESGFSALPGGLRYYNGTYNDMGYYANFWSSTDYLGSNAWYRGLTNDNPEIGYYYFDKRIGFSVRCVMDSTVTDIDGNEYQTVTIGTQVWMAENLKVTHYRNGDAIPNVTVNATWAGLTTGAYCEFNNNLNNVATYGRLYNWYAINDSRNMAPIGWHVATEAEWKQLERHLGISEDQIDLTGYRGTVEGGKLKESGTTHWASPNLGATNECGFLGLPGGLRDYNGNYYDMLYYGAFWTSTASDSYSSWSRHLNANYSAIYRYDYAKPFGFSIRCVRDY